MRAAAAVRDAAAALFECGAASGAAALAALFGGGVRSGPAHAIAPDEIAEWEAGVWFAVSGAVSGTLALVLPASARAEIVEALGPAAAADPASALAEVANIVASQAVTAMAGRLGGRVDLSVPSLCVRGAGAALAGAATFGTATPLASELAGPGRDLRWLLVLLPGAAPPPCDTVGA